MHTIDQINGEGREVCEQRFNLNGLRDESKIFLHRLKLILKLSNVLYSSATNTYEYIPGWLREAALGYLPNPKKITKLNGEVRIWKDLLGISGAKMLRTGGTIHVVRMRHTEQ